MGDVADLQGTAVDHLGAGAHLQGGNDLAVGAPDVLLLHIHQLVGEVIVPEQIEALRRTGQQVIQKLVPSQLTGLKLL